MQKKQSSHFEKLRRKYPVFLYENFGSEFNETGLKISFDFNIPGLMRFAPSAIFHYGNKKEHYINNYFNNKELADLIIFHIGMIEMVSYWKSVCSPEISINNHYINPEQANWWRKLYYHGLGEFLFLNSIQIEENNFVRFRSQGNPASAKRWEGEKEAFIVPIGGGKDSAVSLQLLINAGKQVTPLIINPRGASTDTVVASGIDPNETITITRTLDKGILQLNEQEFLNGHTPFSAMLAFYTLLAALLSGNKNIALSNEDSANEPTIPGTQINHQYSKSLTFENDFRAYYTKYISEDFNYFSFLRPLSELQIISVFSKLTKYHNVFRSCNAGSKTNEWCGKCPKCLFTYIMLSAFTSLEYANTIIGADMLNNPEMKKPFDELCGLADIKPFECVGTIDDVNAALRMILTKEPNANLVLLEHYKQELKQYPVDLSLNELSQNHNLTIDLAIILKEALS